MVAAHPGHGSLIGTGVVVAYVAAKTVSVVRSGQRSGRSVAVGIALLAASMLGVNLAYLLPRLAYLPRTSYGPSYANVPQITGVSAGWPLKFATTPGAHMAAAGLAVAFAALWPNRHRAVAVGVAAWGAVGYVLSLRPVSKALAPHVRSIPGLSFYQHYPGRFAMSLSIAVPVLAALGVEAWAERARARGGIP